MIEWIKSLGQHGGTCTEHFGGFDESPMLFFSCFDMNIPILNKNFETKEHTHYGVGTSGQGFYATYIHPNKTDLVYSASGDTKKDMHAHFTPADSDDLLKGISYQCAAGLGRTSAKQVISILEYYFSPKMKEDMERSIREFRK